MQKKKTKRKTEKKKAEFMQKVVLISLIIFAVWVTLSYVMAFMDKMNPLEDLSACIVSVAIAAIIGYITQNSVRASTYNKYVQNSDNTTIETIETTISTESEGKGF